MKFIFSLIKVGIFILLALLALMLMINDTFIYTFYKTDYMDSEGIPINRFVYKLDNSTKKDGNFITFVSKENLNNKKDEYMNSLSTCYGKYYYDDVNNITLTKYSIMDNGLYRTINIHYEFENYCSEKYHLDDMWVYEYNALTTLLDSSINHVSITSLVDTLNKAERVTDPIIDGEYESSTTITMECQLNEVKYTLEIKDFNKDEVIVIKTKNNEKQFAVYKLENASVYLGALK